MLASSFLVSMWGNPQLLRADVEDRILSRTVFPRASQVFTMSQHHLSNRRERRADSVGRTLLLWQPRTKRELSRADACQIGSNFTDFIKILSEWEAADRSKVASPEP